jgi:hypothetical protein
MSVLNYHSLTAPDVVCGPYLFGCPPPGIMWHDIADIADICARLALASLLHAGCNGCGLPFVHGKHKRHKRARRKLLAAVAQSDSKDPFTPSGNAPSCL